MVRKKFKGRSVTNGHGRLKAATDALYRRIIRRTLHRTGDAHEAARILDCSVATIYRYAAQLNVGLPFRRRSHNHMTGRGPLHAATIALHRRMILTALRQTGSVASAARILGVSQPT